MPDINNWLAELGLEKYGSAFAEAEIDYDTLPDLAEEDLKELGLPLGPRRKVWGAIQRLGVANPLPADASTDPTPKELSTSTTHSDAERRHLTVMFVDLVGSTEMATRLDPEDMRHVITNYQNTVAGIVSRFEGVCRKVYG